MVSWFNSVSSTKVPTISFSLEVNGKNLFKRATVQFPKDDRNLRLFSQILGGNKHTLFHVLLDSTNFCNFSDYLIIYFLTHMIARRLISELTGITCFVQITEQTQVTAIDTSLYGL